jgi:hypothetical protein
VQRDVVAGVDDRGELIARAGCANPAEELRPAYAACQDRNSHPSNLRDAARATQGTIERVPDRLATQLLLIAHDPTTGRLRRPRMLDIGLRAALFTDLVLAGRVTEQYRAPFAEQSTESDDHMLDAVERAVVRRPYVGWWRWFRHVRADRLALVGELLADGRWTDRDGATRALTGSDILVLTPFNAQVNRIRGRLAAVDPGIRVGTVDKFQGQEAPISIYSMATSTPEEAPRGLEFLYSLNRLNVATSRARCAAIVVASPGPPFVRK